VKPIMDQARVRAAMLARIREARDQGAAGAVEVPRDYHRTGSLTPAEVVDLLIDRLVDYKADVLTAQPDSLSATVLQALSPSTSVVVADGLPAGLTEALAAAGLQVTVDGDEHALTAVQLDRIDAVVTTAALAIADNGVIVLDAGPGQGRRIISLVPDLHVVVLRRSQVLQTVPEAVARLVHDGGETRPTTWIAGPSATSDIELNRVEGVHGPRTLRVVIVDDEGDQAQGDQGEQQADQRQLGHAGDAGDLAAEHGTGRGPGVEGDAGPG